MGLSISAYSHLEMQRIAEKVRGDFSVRFQQNVRPLCLLSWRPGLTPVDRLWQKLREKYLCNKALQSLGNVEPDFCEGLGKPPDDLEGLSFDDQFQILATYETNCQVLRKAADLLAEQ